MKTKIIIIITIMMLVALINVNASNTKKSTFKAIEFNIGGSISQYAFFEGGYTAYIDFSNKSKTIEYNFFFAPQGQGFTFSIPLNFLFYPAHNYGIGVKYVPGFTLFLYSGFISGLFQVENKIGVINKIGSIHKTNFLLIELYFITSTLIKPYFNDNLISTDVDFRLYLGPGLFIGYEKHLKNKVNIAIGGIINVDFSIHDNFYGLLEAKDLSTFLKIGLELQIKYSYIKEINS